VRTLGALEARFADDHVPLALVLGALGTLSAVRRLLPDGPGPPRSSAEERADTPVDSFAFLLLGAIVAHDRLIGLAGSALASGGAARTLTAEQPGQLEGILR
jgi:hypothetical protein